MENHVPLHFYDEPIEVVFDVPPVREKAPHCPNGFVWDGETFHVAASLAEWTDFTRRGRMAKNMRPAHAAAASTRGSLNVGRYYFRIQEEHGRIFEIYFDRAMKSVDDRKGQWYLFQELKKVENFDGTSDA